MRISAGISEINLKSSLNNKAVNEKIYLWPQYGESKIEKVRGIVRRTDSNAIYSKPLREDREKILSRYNRIHQEYDSKGDVVRRKTTARPGLLFDAIV